MGALAWVWLASPFVVMAVIAHDPNMRDLVAVHRRRCQAIGWAGVGAMFLGAAVVPGMLGSMMFGLGTPLAGLIVWSGRGGDEGGEGEGGPAETPPGWDEFERSFWAYVRRGARRPSRPRTPAAG